MKISSLTSRPSRRSITQSITGRPATFSSGLGTRWVWGRRRVPFPASGMITCMSAPSVAVLEPDEIVELGGRRLEDVAVHHGLDLVHELGRNVDGLAGAERAGLQLGAGPGAEDQLAPEHVHRLVLAMVILQAQHVSRLDVQDLAHVALGAGPDQLVSPRFVDSVRQVGHCVLRTAGAVSAGEI